MQTLDVIHIACNMIINLSLLHFFLSSWGKTKGLQSNSQFASQFSWQEVFERVKILTFIMSQPKACWTLSMWNVWQVGYPSTKLSFLLMAKTFLASHVVVHKFFHSFLLLSPTNDQFSTLESFYFLNSNGMRRGRVAAVCKRNLIWIWTKQKHGVAALRCH